MLEGEIVGDAWALSMTFSNIDDNAPDGLRGPTTVEISVTVSAP